MTSPSHLKLIPTAVRGMKQLTREKFSRNIEVLTLQISCDNVNNCIPIFKPYIFKLQSFKPVQALSDEHKPLNRCVYLNPEMVLAWKDIPETVRYSLGKHGITEENSIIREIQVTYENFRYDDIFKAVLPEDAEVVSGFSQIGHIIHLNLRSHLLEYKSLIGTVLIDKIKTCRTVINKINVIDNTFRNFCLEVIAGDEDFFVTTKESGCIFQFDFSKVYWNPRLISEHEKIIKCLKPGDILFDVFCGVGPFAVPVAKKKCRVFANDLNPESYKWLNHNASKNQIKLNLFKSYNLDGKEFICKIFKDFIEECCKGKEEILPGAKIHVTMNLPAIAVTFLKYFNGLIGDKNFLDCFNLDIIVYVYCFTTGTDHVEVAKQMVINNIGRDVSNEILDVHFVRNVAPQKNMYKVVVRLTKEILFGVNVEHEISEPPMKKKCIESTNA